ncbi:hypothetical protein [Amphritea sp. HPY]|uniref:hypothetical protein n=1 Tax=Amphritea sp. HPY TaxID=3421652 RepID=UPI003D7E4821
MDYLIKSVNHEEGTMVIEWANGVRLNHFIPLLILEGEDLTIAELDALIRNEAPEDTNG